MNLTGGIAELLASSKHNKQPYRTVQCKTLTCDRCSNNGSKNLPIRPGFSTVEVCSDLVTPAVLGSPADKLIHF